MSDNNKKLPTPLDVLLSKTGLASSDTLLVLLKLNRLLDLGIEALEKPTDPPPTTAPEPCSFNCAHGFAGKCDSLCCTTGCVKEGNRCAGFMCDGHCATRGCLKHRVPPPTNDSNDLCC